MGLLMYGWKEAEEERKKKESIKLDSTAASRSAIRRQPTIRRRDNPVGERRTGRASPRAVRLSLGNYVVDDRDGEFVIAPRPRPRPSEAGPSWEADSRRTYRAEFEEHRLSRRRGELAFERQRQRQLLAANGSSNLPSAEDLPQTWAQTSQLRNEIRRRDELYEREVDRLTRARERHSGRAQENVDIEERIAELMADPTVNPNALRRSPPPPQSERFAPAYRFGRDSPRPTREPVWAQAYARRSRSPRQGELRGESRTGSPGVLSPNFPPLERQRARGPTVEPRAATPRHDINSTTGLGDRRRSFGSDDGWETLVTTIAHDERLPSADSSFASATASTSFSQHADSQPSTSATSPSLANRDSMVQHEGDCDDVPELIPILRSASSSVRPEHVQGGGRSNVDENSDSQLLSRSLDEVRRDIEIYSRSRMQRLLGSFLDRGERVPDHLWQAFVPRNVLAGAAESSNNDQETVLGAVF